MYTECINLYQRKRFQITRTIVPLFCYHSVTTEQRRGSKSIKYIFVSHSELLQLVIVSHHLAIFYYLFIRDLRFKSKCAHTSRNKWSVNGKWCAASRRIFIGARFAHHCIWNFARTDVIFNFQVANYYYICDLISCGFLFILLC